MKGFLQKSGEKQLLAREYLASNSRTPWSVDIDLLIKVKSFLSRCVLYDHYEQANMINEFYAYCNV